MFFARGAAPLMILAALACSPNRPANVPDGATWVGSGTEGCFLKIGEREILGWQMEGWGRDGTQVVEGIWDLDGIARARINIKEITRFDGEMFYLVDGAKIYKQK